MSVVVRGGVGVARRFSVTDEAFGVNHPPRVPFPVSRVRLVNTGAADVHLLFERSEVDLCPNEQNYINLAAGQALDVPLELVVPPVADRGLWLRSTSGTVVVEALLFQKR